VSGKQEDNIDGPRAQSYIETWEMYRRVED
jgi:hypothetical protein